MPVIYIDVLLALNLWIDFLLLLVTARILRLTRKRWRLVVGALMGACCSCLIFLPEMPVLAATGVKVVAAAMILIVAFPWQGLFSYIKSLTVFFISSTMFAGLASALWFFAAPQGFFVVNGVVYYDVAPLTLVLLTVISYGILCIYDRIVRKKAPINHEYKLLITCGEGTAAVRALYDSGNELSELFSGNPVVVVRRNAIAHILPVDMREVVYAGGTADAADMQAAVQSRIRLIPFQSVGGNGLLPAFQPTHMTVVSGDGRQSRDITGAYVAICETLGRGEYDALLGSDIGNLFASERGKSA